MRKLLIFLIAISILISCDTFMTDIFMTTKKTRVYDQYMIVWEGLSPQAFRAVLDSMGTPSSSSRHDYELCQRYPAITDGEKYPEDAPLPYYNTVSYSDMKAWVESFPLYENDPYMWKLIYDHLGRDGAVWRYDAVPNKTNTFEYLFYLYIEGQGVYR